MSYIYIYIYIYIYLYNQIYLFMNIHLSNLKLHFKFLNSIQNRTTLLIYFTPKINFCTSQKRETTSNFLTLSGFIGNGKIG